MRSASLAEVAVRNNYVCPEIEVSHTLTIAEGRHPVVEQMQRDTLFVPNDTHLNDTDDRVAIVTGPNMAGKAHTCARRRSSCSLEALRLFFELKTISDDKGEIVMKKAKKVLLVLGVLLIAAGVFVGVTLGWDYFPTIMPTTILHLPLPIRRPATAS